MTVYYYCSGCGAPRELPDLNKPEPCPNCGEYKMQTFPKRDAPVQRR